MSLRPYGDCVLKRHDDGRIELIRADPVIGISVQLLVEADPQVFSVDPDGNLVVAWQAAYRPVGFSSSTIIDAAGPMRVLICEKVW